MKIDSNYLQKSIKYWRESSFNDFKAAKILFEKGLYPQSLFFCHLSLEKILKALFIKKTKEFAPFVHDLRRLAELAGVNLTKEQQMALDKIFTFNIAGRYSEEKFEFYQKYNNKAVAAEYLEITKNLLLWLKKEFQKK
ncbi:MAG: HEPN domain-containing protein [Patescibacteria group bacterium]|nr:HEPN domain-containing protein [Patescibacteria group bacterium]